jgi:hypothetical protein
MSGSCGISGEQTVSEVSFLLVIQFLLLILIQPTAPHLLITYSCSRVIDTISFLHIYQIRFILFPEEGMVSGMLFF